MNQTILKLKVNYNGDIRIWRYNQSLDFVELRRFIMNSWGDDNLIPQFTDEDGDLITITSFHDLSDAVHFAQRSNKRGLMISVRNDVFRESVSMAELQTQIRDLRQQIDLLLIHKRSTNSNMNMIP